MKRIIPYRVKPKIKGIMLLNLVDTFYDYHEFHKGFMIMESSGIIHSGFTLEFFLEYEDYFIKCTKRKYNIMNYVDLKTHIKVEDETFMRWGKHSGERLQNIPAKYLIWLRGYLYKNKKLDAWSRALFNYINDNIEVLEKEVSENNQ